MASKLILGPEYKEMTDQWLRGGKYRVEILITQTSKDGIPPFEATIDEVTDYGDADGGDTESVPVKPPKTPPKLNAKAKETEY